MKSSVCALAVLVAVLGTFWLGSPGCASGDDSGPGPCRIQATCTNGTCCGGVAGGWSVMTSMCTCPDGGGETDAHDDGVTTDDGGGHDDGGPVGGGPGSACNCDADCTGGDATHAPVCDGGVCMLLASAACSAAGSTVECPAHLRCWTNGAGGNICWPDCDTFTGCVGDCDADGSCVPNATTTCDPACGSYCASGK